MIDLVNGSVIASFTLDLELNSYKINHNVLGVILQPHLDFGKKIGGKWSYLKNR